MYFIVYGVVALAIGGLLIWKDGTLWEEVIQYQDDCKATSTEESDWTYQYKDKEEDWCKDDTKFKITLDKDVKGPIYLYYQLTNFY